LLIFPEISGTRQPALIFPTS